MTAWEKLQNGQIYNDFDTDLFQRRITAKKLFRAYNQTKQHPEKAFEKSRQKSLDRTGFPL